MTVCIEWTGAHTHDGYSIRQVGGRKDRRTIYIHREAYERAKGPIPPGYQVDHLCRNRGCVNPDHLEAVTPQENNRRGMSITARAMRRNGVCSKGHDVSGDNLYLWHGRRYCRQCRAEYAKARQKGRPAGCRNGHQYTAENTYWNPVGFRVCLTCRRAGDRRRSKEGKVA